MLISHETHLGLRITGKMGQQPTYKYILLLAVHSLVEFLQYIFTILGVSLFLSNKLSQVGMGNIPT